MSVAHLSECFTSESLTTEREEISKEEKHTKSRSSSSLCRYEDRKKNILRHTRTVWITKQNIQNHNQFCSRYTKLKPLGAAGVYGQAFQCERKSDHKMCAVKEISKSELYKYGQRRKTLLENMEAEVHISKRLHHRYIINTYEIYETKHKLSIIMEECKGGELFERIIKKGGYIEQDAKPIIRNICEALVYMHNTHNIVHGDLKADNILFKNKNETSNEIKIIDFGMSRVCKKGKSLGTLVGTPYYTAPEVISGSYAHAADMWSVGIILYVMIFAFPPFHLPQNGHPVMDERKALYQTILRGFDPVLKDGFGAWFPKRFADNLSESGRDFISNLLEMDTSKRLTANQALHHSWLFDGKESAEFTEYKCETSTDPDLYRIHNLNNGIIKQGYLMKKCKVISLWKKQNFVLNHDGTLRYYSNKSYHTLNVKNLTKLINKSWGNKECQKYGIKIYTQKKKWRLVCESEYERGEWMRAIENVSKKKRLIY